MEREIEILKKLIEEKEPVHINELEHSGLKPSYSLPSMPNSVVVCVFCNEPWTPEMITMEEAMGYCESCYDTSNVNFIACSKCGKIVYSK